jgi:uncharacterized membrane protein
MTDSADDDSRRVAVAPGLADPPKSLAPRELWLLFAAAAALQFVAWALVLSLLSRMVPLLWEATSPDVARYAFIAESIRRGSWPYAQFQFEYPPLTLIPLLIPLHSATVAGYAREFRIEMLAVFTLTALVTTWAAVRLWGTLGRSLAAAAAFAAAVVASGMIGLNRFDGTVALVVALCVLCLACRRWALAGLMVGLGFSLKLMPIVLLPLVLVMARRWRLVWWATLAAAAGAVIPFVPFVVRDPGRFWASLVGGQTARGLQIESVAASPFLLRDVLQPGSVTVVVPPGGSMSILAAGAQVANSLAPMTVLALVIVAYLVIWRVREALRADSEAVPVAVLALMLAAMCGNKVLSPQHMIWVLPVVALALVAKRPSFRVPAAIAFVAIILTQVEYPGMYMSIMHLGHTAILVVAARNLLLVGALVAALIALWRLPRDDQAVAAGTVVPLPR